MNKKVIIISSIIIVIIILCILVVCFLNQNVKKYSTILKLNWNIVLPEEAKITEIYNDSEDSSFLGDGIRFHIFTYENEDIIEKMFNWSIEEKETLFYSSYSESINEWLNQTNVPTKYIPNYSNCRYWYNKQEDNSEIIVAWDKTENKLYIVESFL